MISSVRKPVKSKKEGIDDERKNLKYNRKKQPR